MAVLKTLLTIIPREIAAGRIIGLGEFGSFRLRIQSAGSDIPTEVTANNIKMFCLALRPVKSLSRC